MAAAGATAAEGGDVLTALSSKSSVNLTNLVPPRRGRRQSTNDFIRSVLDNAVRDSWVGKQNVTKKQKDYGRRISNLYGVNISHKIVKKRVKRGERPPSSGSVDGGPGLSALRRSSTYSRKSLRSGGSTLLKSGSSTLHSVRGDASSVFPSSSPRSHADGGGFEDSMMDSLPKAIRGEVEAHERRKQERDFQLDLSLTGGGPTPMPSRGLLEPLGSLTSNYSMPAYASTVKGGGQGGSMATNGRATPWYCGYTNSATRAPATVFANAARYGCAGSQKLAKKNAYTATASLEHYHPGFLHPPSVHNEYAPPLTASPSLWPNKSRYVCGSKLKTMPPPT